MAATGTPHLESPSIVDFISRNHRVFLFCRDGARRPIGYAMRSVAYHSTTHWLYFATYTKSAKVRHLMANPEVACLVSSDILGDDNSRWVSVGGTAEIRRPSPTEVDDLIGSGSPDGRVPDEVAAKVTDRLLSGKRSFIRVTLAEVRAAHLPDGVTARNRHGG